MDNKESLEQINFKKILDSMRDNRSDEYKSYDDNSILLMYKTIVTQYWESFKKVKDVMIEHQSIENKIYLLILEMYIRDLQLDDETYQIHLNMVEHI